MVKIKAFAEANKIKIITTLMLFYGNFCFGMSNFIVGPSIIDLMVIMKTNIETISLWFTIVRIGYTFGAFFGFLYNYLNRNLMVVFLLAMIGICLAIVPQMPGPIYVFVCAALVGIGLGGFDCALTVSLVEIWQQKAGPFFQISSLSCTIGAILAPLIVNPFLTSKRGSSTNSTLTLTTLTSNKTLASDMEPDRRARLTIPYAIIGAIIIFNALLFLILFFYKKKKAAERKRLRMRRRSIGSFLIDDEASKPPPKLIVGRPAILLTVFSVLLVASYFTMEATYLQLFPTFAHYSVLQIPESSAALILSSISTAQFVGKFAGIFLAIKFSPNLMLSVNFAIIITGYMIVLLFGHTALWVMWTGNIIVGIGFSSSIPSIYSFIRKYMVITNIKGTLLISSAGTCQSLSLAVVSRFVKSHPDFLLYTNFFLIATSITFFIAIQILAWFCNSTKTESEKSNSNEEKTGEESFRKKSSKRISWSSAQQDMIKHSVAGKGNGFDPSLVCEVKIPENDCENKKVFEESQILEDTLKFDHRKRPEEGEAGERSLV